VQQFFTFQIYHEYHHPLIYHLRTFVFILWLKSENIKNKNVIAKEAKLNPKVVKKCFLFYVVHCEERNI